MRPTRPLAAVLVLAVVLVACRGEDPVVEETATPTAVASPSTEPSPSPTPSPEPTGPLAPLTGLVVDEEDAARPALAAKVENTRAAQPQAGLEVADLVIEELVEGGITRFMAVFQSTVPEQVGPVRSARLVDADLLPAFDGGLLYSGGRSDVEAAIGGGAVRITEGDPGVYRAGDRRAPHNLFAEGPAVYETLLDRAPELEAPPSGFVFADEPPAGACEECDGTQLDVRFSPAATTGWAWDAGAGVYRRSQNGTDQPTASGEPVGAANVVVVEVSTYNGGCCDTAGSPYVVSRTTGEGRAVVLRDGRWYEATWVRPGAESPWRLETADGQDLALAPGPTWLLLVPSAGMPATGGGEDAGS